MSRSTSIKLRPFSRGLAGALLCILFVFGARIVAQTEQSSRRNLEDRFRLRTEIAEPFLRSYVRALLQREATIAERALSAATISESDFDTVVRAFGFEAAVIIDASGKLLRVYPSRHELIGSDIAPRYEHLRDALAHGSAVSSVVPSAALGAPIVGFAARYDTPSGRRVFSGAHDISLTPLNAYMSNLLPIRGAHADLVDVSRSIVASNRRIDPRSRSLAIVDPSLAQAASKGSTGLYQGDGGRKLFVARQVAGTPWRLILSVNESALYAPLVSSGRHVNRWLFAAFCVATLFAAYVLLRLIDSRAELQALNVTLARVARLDRLTGLPNRLYLEEQLERALAAARRHAQSLSVLVIDVDRFKVVNDSYGHSAGDEVLRSLASRMAGALRGDDMLGRWGGEEFLALLPNTDSSGAAVAAERVRCAANAAPIIAGEQALRVTVSIGCATTMDEPGDRLLPRADSALYRAKSLGRDCVVSSVTPAATPAAPAERHSLAQ
jgi:diguanylate cyclase (GGDEF)-like protein